MEPIIEVKNLFKVFHSRGKKITAVNDVSFNVFKGEIFGIEGDIKYSDILQAPVEVNPTGLLQRTFGWL
jgi:ABC-type phosphonate transport system ATPase subunit